MEMQKESDAGGSDMDRQTMENARPMMHRMSSPVAVVIACFRKLVGLADKLKYSVRYPIFFLLCSKNIVFIVITCATDIRSQNATQDGITQLLRSYFEELSFAILIIKEQKKHAF